MARWTKPIFIFCGIEILVSSVHSFYTGKTGIMMFLSMLMVAFIFLLFTWIFSPPIYRRNKPIKQ
jgi:hypothetical protein